MLTRRATGDDVGAIARLVNRAYEVERFFVEGDRVTPDAVRHDLTTGTILVVDSEDGAPRACVYVSVTKSRGYFGMLAVDPSEQGRGLGRRLIDEAEAYARALGATAMDISVVNVRTDLLAYYARLGYIPIGTEPYVHRPVTQSVHFVKMAKSLN